MKANLLQAPSAEASYFPSIEEKYGKPMDYWLAT